MLNREIEMHTNSADQKKKKSHENAFVSTFMQL